MGSKGSSRNDCPLPPGSRVAGYFRDSGGDEQERSVDQQRRVAEEYCQQAIDIDVEYAAAWQQIGQVYYAQSKFQQSIDAYEQCVALESDSIYCWYQRGLAYIYLDQCDEAVPLLQESMERTQSDRILGHVREGLRMCQQEPPTPTPEEGEATGDETGEADS